ncbi:hypothetical protein SETIT_6G147700v2 [Setaria italica]|uniref:Uncharacterized protein n=1 Tax=Setaria italica TaxID=4555 RepID=A0A368RLJ7_SETIT|nr:hypothetical protein SETIT_6G147700v2 [Setaria italica]
MADLFPLPSTSIPPPPLLFLRERSFENLGFPLLDPMAAADAGIASPRASLARSRLALAAADAVMYLWLASMWLTFAAAAATEIGRVASCRPMVDAVSKVNDAAFISFALLSPVANLLLAFRKVDSPRDKAVKELAMESTAEVIAEAMREMLRNTLSELLVPWAQMRRIALSSFPILLRCGGRSNR